MPQKKPTTPNKPARPPDGAKVDGSQQWYWVRALYKALLPERPRRKHLWESTVFLVRGSSESEASRKAAALARSKEQEYIGGCGDRVQWVLVGIEEMQPIMDDELKDGTEVYWRHFHKFDEKPG